MGIQFDHSVISNARTQHLERTVNKERMFSIFKDIADTYAPSQTVSYTRAPVIENLIQNAIDRCGMRFERDYHGTGNVVLMCGDVPDAVVVAHADEISYLLSAAPTVGDTQLLPFCAHRASEQWPVRVLRYDPESSLLQVQAQGALTSRDVNGRPTPFLATDSQDLHIGDRVVFHHELEHGPHDLVYGKVDNAAGVAVSIMTILALAELDACRNVWFVFPDEEEGPPDSNSTFARGSRRLIHELSLPAGTLFIVVDGHDTAPDQDPAPTALYTEKESLGRGNVVPPDLYAALQRFATALNHQGINICENPSYVARSDSPAIMERYRNLLQIGYPVKNAHFDAAPPSTSLEALTSLARALTYMLMSLRTGPGSAQPHDHNRQDSKEQQHRRANMA